MITVIDRKMIDVIAARLARSTQDGFGVEEEVIPDAEAEENTEDAGRAGEGLAAIGVRGRGRRRIDPGQRVGRDPPAGDDG